MKCVEYPVQHLAEIPPRHLFLDFVGLVKVQHVARVILVGTGEQARVAAAGNPPGHQFRRRRARCLARRNAGAIRR